MEFMLVVLIVILVAYMLGEGCKLLRIPRVVGQILAGMILGIPFVKHYFLTGNNSELLQFLAELGILLLFFFVGLQINLFDFKKHVGESSMIALFNTLIPFLAGVVVFKILGFGTIAAIIVGICLSLSSQAVSIDVLEELHKLKSKVGKHVITAGAIDDIVELVLISIVLALIQASIGQATVISVALYIALFAFSIILFRFIIVPLLLRAFAQEHSTTYLFTGAIVVTLLMAIVTKFLGVGSIVGALFAGIIVREVLLTGKHKKPWEEHNIAFAIHVVAFGFFVPIFFVWIGLNTDIGAVITEWKTIILLVSIAFIGTIGGTILGVLAHKRGTLKEGWITGWGLSPKGDVELVIAALALAQGLITESLFSALILMAFFTTLIAPLMFRYLVQKEYKNRMSHRLN